MERHESIREIEASHLPRRRSCRAMGVPKSTYYVLPMAEAAAGRAAWPELERPVVRREETRA